MRLNVILVNKKMELKFLGSTNLKVSPIGLGLAALGRPGYINLGHEKDLEQDYDASSMQARAHRVLNAAYDAGVRYFDAARSYGRAEEFLGSWLQAKELSHERVKVGSKWGYTYTADWQVDAEIHEVKEHSLAVLNRQWKESRENLGAYLDLYQIHSATWSSGVLGNKDVLNALARLKENGIAIGLSVSGEEQPDVIKQAIEAAVDGVRLFDCVQATWNLLEQSAGEALSHAKGRGMSVIIKEALANGRLTDRNKETAFLGKWDILKQEASRLNTTIDGLAIAAVLAQPWSDVVLSGAASVEHLESNLKAVAVTWDEAAESVLGKLEEPAGVYWKRRSELAWK